MDEVHMALRSCGAFRSNPLDLCCPLRHRPKVIYGFCTKQVLNRIVELFCPTIYTYSKSIVSPVGNPIPEETIIVRLDPSKKLRSIFEGEFQSDQNK